MTTQDHDQVRLRRPLAILALAAGVLAVAACAQTPPSRFYTLTPITDGDGASSGQPSSELTVGLGPVVVPDYLDRSEIVSRSGTYEVEIAEFDRWSGSLETMIPRIMTQNLSAALNTDRVMIFPQRRAPEADYHAEVEIFRFDAGSSGDVVLDVQWELYGNRTGRPLTVEKTTIRQPVSGEGYPAIAAAMSEALKTLTDAIADAIRTRQ